MAKNKLLRGCRLYVGGYDLSGDSRTFGSLDNDFAEVENHGWNQGNNAYLADGIRRVGLSGYQAMLNDATGRSHDALATVPGSADVLLTIGAGGAAPIKGDPAYILPGVQLEGTTSWNEPLGLVTANWQRKAGATGTTGYDTPWGVVLYPLTATSSNVEAIIGPDGASTTGYTATLHITATSSGDFPVILLEHSTNSVDWSTLSTFTLDGSAVGSETVSGTGAVNTWVRFAATRSSGSATMICAFARNYR